MSISALDSRIFRNLFGTEEVREIFTDEAYAKFLVQTEAALARAESKVNAIPADVGDAITSVLGNIELEYVDSDMQSLWKDRALTYNIK